MSSVQIRTSPFATSLEPLAGSFGQNVIRRTTPIFGSRILYRFCQNEPVSGPQEVATECSYYADDIFDFCQSCQRTQNVIPEKEKSISTFSFKVHNFIFKKNRYIQNFNNTNTKHKIIQQWPCLQEAFDDKEYNRHQQCRQHIHCLYILNF